MVLLAQIMLILALTKRIPFMAASTSRQGYYILDESKKVVPVGTFKEWAEWFEKADRTVAKTVLPSGDKVSTIFLGLDHAMGEEPEIFESMVFGGESNGEIWRYATWEEAEAGHQRLVQELSGEQKSL
jgi:hypothetical protein